MKEILRHGLTAAVVMAGAHFGSQIIENPVANAAGLISQPTGDHLVLTKEQIDHIKTANEVRKDTAATFIMAAGVLGVTLLSYRMSDGTRNKVEKYSWMIGVPGTFTVGAGMLLALMWQDNIF